MNNNMINDRSDTSTKTQKKKICNSAVDIYQEQKLHILILQIVESVKILKCSVYSHHCLSRSGISVEQAVNESASCQWKGQGQGHICTS